MTNILKSILATLSIFAVVACSSDEKNGEPSVSDSTEIIGISNKKEPKISYCLPRYISDAETRTIYEVFTGEEMPYGHLILRSNPDKRAGMYFFVMFGYAPDGIGLACKFVLEVDSNKAPHHRKFVFEVPETHSVLREVKLGLTGKDWSRDEKVNAWRLTLLSPSGKVLTQSQSWLWDVENGISKLKKDEQKAENEKK